ncbi:UNVERIFIED_CONTAM: hypothetical protein GTU68_048638 [Idotea baltica]|nr:hypothetical protein [Idotea baltica]
MGLDIITQMLIQEGLGHAHSFTTAFAAQTGIGTYPVQYFGTVEQKQKYLPGISSGEIKPCYNLTEPNAGSDALSGKTSATLTPDGKNYLINGQKCWITNSGFSDLFVVFAKVDGQHFTCFLVPADAEGLTLGDEEYKMGIKGSSTRQVFYSDVKVPVENVVGEIGRGHKIAFNALNMGRIKLGAACVGGARHALNLSIAYASEREQFGSTLSKFGAIQYKLAEMATQIFALESAVYRAAALLVAAEEYAIECAMTKVYGSEVLDYAVDEAVQIHGGNGFSSEYPVDRCYRDSRITRIYEGTSEINRLLVVNTLIKRVASGRLNINGPITADDSTDTSPLAAWRKSVGLFKKATLGLLGEAAQTFEGNLRQEQQVSMNLSNMVIDVYHAESILLRTEKIITEKGESEAGLYIALCQLYLFDAADRIAKNGKDAIVSFVDGDSIEMLLGILKDQTAVPAVNVRDLRRKVASRLIGSGKYDL